MFGAPLDDWVNGGFVDIYSYLVSVVLVLWGIGPILRNKFGNDEQKVCYIASGKQNVSRVTLQGFNIKYKLL